MRTAQVLASLCIIWALNSSAQFIKFGPDKTVPVLISHAPEFGLTVKRVAFGQPEGSCMAEATQLMDSQILPDFQQNHMDVIERQALDQIMSEHNFNRSMYADAGAAVKLGKILGPSALIIVSVNLCNATQTPLVNDQQNILNNQIVRTFISKTRYSIEGSLRVVDLTTGTILGSHNFQSKPEKSNQSQQGPPEFPPVDEIRNEGMQQAGFQIHAMFFPSGDQVAQIFYDDKDCTLNQVYQAFRNGDHDGAMRMMDANLEECKAGKHKDKSLARAYYDDGLLHCMHGDYDKAATLFTGAMDAKGAEGVASASGTCERAKRGAEALKAYEAKLGID